MKAAAEDDKMKVLVENMSKKVEFLETQKKSLRKTIFSVFFEWKGFEEQIASTQNCFRDCLSELESKEKELCSVQDSLSQTAKDLDSERDSLKKKLQQVEDKEKEFKLFSDKGIKKLNKEREDFSKEVEFREANFCELEKTLEDLLKKHEIQRDEIEEKKQKIIELNKESEEFLKEIENSKESVKEMERRRLEVEGKEANIMKLKRERDEFLKEIEFQKVDIMIEEVNFKEKDVALIKVLNEKRSKELDIWEKQLAARVKDVELIRELNERRWNELDTREKQLAAIDTRLQLLIQEEDNNTLEKKSEDHIRRLETEPKEKEVQLSRETNEKHSKEPRLQKCSNEGDNLDSSRLTWEECHLEKNLQRHQLVEGHHASVAVEKSAGRQTREENQLNDEHHASLKEEAAEEPKERQLHKRVHEENCNDNQLKKKGNPLEKELSVKEKTPSLVGKEIREEGYDLYKFLQDHGKGLNKVVNQVMKTIQQSKEPAKLVLAAIGEFYYRVIRVKETEEKKDIAFRSCILLLEQLMKLSVDSHLSSLKDDALKLARVWKSNMKIRDSFEVLGFLYLLASYKLADAFPVHVVIRCLEAVALRRKTRDLCRRLDLKDNGIHELITELLRKDRILLAFDYVHDLELVHVFPPVPLLKSHVQYASTEARRMGNNNNKGKKNHESKKAVQDRELSFEISALKDVMKCIMRRNLQAEYPPDELKERIQLLERQRKSLKASSSENQKVDSYGSANAQHDNTNCLSKKKRRCLDRGGGYNKSELPPPSKCPRQEVNHSEGSNSRWQQQQQKQQHNQSPRHVHPDDSAFHTRPFSPRWQQQQHNQSPRLVPPPEGNRSGTPSSCHPNDTAFHTGPYSPRRPLHNQSNPLCHVNDLVNKYATAGNRESVYPANHFPHVEQPPLQSGIMAPNQSFYPAHPSYIR